MRRDELSAAEQAVWDAFPAAATVDLAGGEEPVRAEVVAALLLGAREAEPGRVPAVRLSGARLTGVLDLSYAEALYALLLNDCVLEEAPLLVGARTGLINLSGSRLPGLRARDAQIDGLLVLAGCTFDGPVELPGAQVSGSIVLTGAAIHANPAVRGPSLSVGRDLLCGHAVLDGEMLMWSARVGGVLELSDATLDNPSGVSFSGDGIVVEGGLFAEGLTAQGTLRLQDARIGRRCSFTGASLSDPGGVALNGEKLHVDGSLTLDKGFTAEGEIFLLSATVQGTVLLIDATVRNAGGRSVNAGLSTIDGGFRAYPGFHAEGEVSLGAAQVRGSVNLKGARLSAPGGNALWAARLQVNGGLFCGEGFSAEGGINVVDASIGASMDFSGARLRNAGGYSLTAWGLTVGGVVDCCEGFHADGSVSFSGAKIASALCMEGATIDDYVSLVRLQAASLVIRSSTTFHAQVDLRHARIGWLNDDASRWPQDLRMEGLVYESLSSPLPVEDRLAWLAGDSDGYQPQPYEQLATVYRGQGHDQAARAVLLAKQRRRRATQPLPLKLWEYVQDWTVGYGYQPSRAGLWLAALLLIGTAAFSTEHPPAAKAGESPPFNPLLYSLDLLLPIVSFGQESAFNPHGGHQWLAAAMIATGWLLATTIATGVTRVLSRQ